MTEVRRLELVKGRHDKSVLYKVAKGTKVLFKLGPEFLAESSIKVMTNYPVVEGGQYDRSVYTDITSGHGAELTLSRAGAFHYYVVTGDNDDDKVCDGYINVDPQLPHNLTLDSIGQQQTPHVDSP